MLIQLTVRMKVPEENFMKPLWTPTTIRVLRRALPCAAVALAFATNAMSATDSDKCEASKNKVAGSFYACLSKAVASGIQKGTNPDYSKCDEKFTSSWDKAESKVEDACPDNVVGDELRDLLFSQQSVVAPILAGAEGVPVCGDGVVNVAGEQCDGTDLGGAGCESLSHEYGTLACNSSCRFEASSCGECPDGSTPFDNSCWVLSEETYLGQSCTQACQLIGLTCNLPALLEVGSEGTEETCQDVLNAVVPAGAPYSSYESSPDSSEVCGPDVSGAGCIFLTDYFSGFSTAFRRTGTPTTCAADMNGEECGSGGRRACACR
jgi:hypothetical protein